MNAFETSFAQWFGLPYAFSFWKGRVALYAILKALDVKAGDEIILPGYTCVMNVNPIKYLGAKPVYVDIEPNTFNINPDLIELKITPRTKIIIAQHTYGYPCNMDRILSISQKYNLAVVEDCCLCLGSTYKGQKMGTFGTAAYFSFQWNKPFTTGLGGMLVTSNKKLADKIQAMRDTQACQPSTKEALLLKAELSVYRLLIFPRTTAMAQQLFRFLTKKGIVVGSSSSAEFEPVMAPDFFKLMSPYQVRHGLHQIRKIEQNIAHRKNAAVVYDQLLTQKSFPSRYYDKSLIDPVLVRYPLRINEKTKAIEMAASAGVELGSWFECPLHPVETLLEKYDYIPGMCPVAEKASKETVNLPLHPRTSERTLKRTVEFITKFKQAT
jgi:dTDP-4-amino-4,6-dideoxygalactose transaminase